MPRPTSLPRAWSTSLSSRTGRTSSATRRDGRRSPTTRWVGWDGSGTVELQQKLGVAPGLVQPVEQLLDALHRFERLQGLAQPPDDRQLLRVKQNLFFPGTGRIDIDGGKEPAVGHRAQQPELGIAGALELLEDEAVTG